MTSQIFSLKASALRDLSLKQKCCHVLNFIVTCVQHLQREQAYELQMLMLPYLSASELRFFLNKIDTNNIQYDILPGILHHVSSGLYYRVNTCIVLT